MKVFGLTGGIASGKSTVAALLEARGVPVLDADRFARQVVEPGQPALAEIAQAFGPEVLQGDGGLDRERLGAIIFHDAEARARLNAIVHPRVRLAMAQAVMEHAARGRGVVVMDIPLLYEARDPADFAGIVVVWVDGETQRARLMARNGLSRAEADARIGSQMSLDEKKARADWVVDNRGSREETEAQVDRLVAEWTAEADQ